MFFKHIDAIINRWMWNGETYEENEARKRRKNERKILKITFVIIMFPFHTDCSLFSHFSSCGVFMFHSFFFFTSKNSALRSARYHHMRSRLKSKIAFISYFFSHLLLSVNKKIYVFCTVVARWSLRGLCSLLSLSTRIHLLMMLNILLEFFGATRQKKKILQSTRIWFVGKLCDKFSIQRRTFVVQIFVQFQQFNCNTAHWLYEKLLK